MWRLSFYSPTPNWAELDTDRRHAVEEQADCDLASRSVSAVIVHPLLCALLSSLLPLADDLRLAMPVAAIVLFSALRAYIVRARRKFSGHRVPLWRGLFASAVLGTALCWAALCIHSVLVYGFAWESMMILACTVGLNAGATITLSPGARLATAYNVLFLAPVSLACLAVGGLEGYSLAVGCTIQLVFYLVEIRRVHAQHFGLLVNKALLELREDRVQRSQHELRELLGRSPSCTAICSGGRIVYANQAWCESLGYERPEDLQGLPITALVDASEEPTPGAAEDLPTGNTQMVGYRGRKVVFDLKPGQQIRFDGEPALLVVGIDITERVQMQQQLRMADRLASVGTLAAGVAHEINNPLAYIIGNLDYIAEQLVSHASGDGLSAQQLSEVVQAAREAQQGAGRVRVIVKDLRTFARADEHTWEVVSPRDAVESAISLSAHEIRHRAQLVRRYEETPPVEANEGRLTQVLTNLLINAAHAIEPGHAEGNQIIVRTSTDVTGSALVEVSDSGAGISPADLEHVFDPFYSTKPPGVGTGLGLAICHTMVSEMKGQLTLENNAGRGTTARLVLPAATVHRSPTLTQLPAVSLPSPRPARVLVIDDEPMVAHGLVRMLEGHEVKTATSGPEALRMFEDSRFDLVLCDLLMPDMTGMDLYERVRVLQPQHARRMVFITGGASNERVRAFLDRVPDRWLEKPFDPQQVRALLSQFLSSSPSACYPAVS